MKDLIQIRSALTPAQVAFLKRFLAAESSDGRGLRIQFFNLLSIDEANLDEETACRKLYGKAPSDAFRKLRSRLKKDMLNALLLRLGNDKEESQYRNAELACRRLLLQGDLLLKRGAVEEGLRLLKKASRLAKQHELPAEGLQIDEILRTHLGYSKGIKAYERYTEGIHEQLLLLNKINEAREANYRILLPHMFKSNLGDEYLVYTRDAYQKLSDAYRQTGSPNVGYMYYLTGLYYFDLIGDYDAALDNAHKFLTHIASEPAIRSSTRLANANLQIANIHLLRFEFKQAIPFASAAVEGFLPGRSNQMTALELLFFAYFRDAQWDEASRITERAFKQSRLKKNSFTYAKWMFMTAALQFEQRQFEKSLQSLNRDFSLLKDKSGWLFGYKLLEILILFESGEYSLIEFRVEALRKLLQRQRQRNVGRISAIFRILVQLVRDRYQIDRTLAAMREELEALEGAEGDMHWEPTGYEIIRFDSWIKRPHPAHDQAAK